MRLVRHDESSPYYGYVYQDRTPWNAREYAESQLDPAFCSEPEPATVEETRTIRTAKAVEPVTESPAEDEIPDSHKYARWLAQQALPTPQRFAGFLDTVAVWTETFPQANPGYAKAAEDAEDEADEEAESNVGMIEAYAQAVHESQRTKHLTRIYRLTGQSLFWEISTAAEAYNLYISIHDCLLAERRACRKYPRRNSH